MLMSFGRRMEGGRERSSGCVGRRVSPGGEGEGRMRIEEEKRWWPS